MPWALTTRTRGNRETADKLYRDYPFYGITIYFQFTLRAQRSKCIARDGLVQSARKLTHQTRARAPIPLREKYRTGEPRCSDSCRKLEKFTPHYRQKKIGIELKKGETSSTKRKKRNSIVATPVPDCESVHNEVVLCQEPWEQSLSDQQKIQWVCEMVSF